MDKQSAVILHGWGSKISRWGRFRRLLERKFIVFLPTLPGFSGNLPRPFRMSDYTKWLAEYMRKNKIKDPLLIGHSFGGRIAVEYAAIHQVGKLVLIASSGIKPKDTIKKQLFRFVAKSGKGLFVIPLLTILKKPSRWLLYTLAGEKDYYRSRGYLRKTMVNILKRDTAPILTKIKSPTLILWGGKDKSTPIADAGIFHKRITNSLLVVYDKEGHGLPFTQTNKVTDQIIRFCAR